MARLNVDDSWWIDPRRIKLVLTIGDEFSADGVMLSAWRLSQEYWKKGKRPIPSPKFMLLKHAEAILSAGLAEVRDEFVYVKGSEQHHQWLLDRAEDGSKGGKAKARNHSGISLANSSKPKQTVASSSSSSSSSKRKTTTAEEKPATDVAAAAALFNLWNKNRGRLPEAMELTPQRARLASERWGEVPDEGYWTEVIRRMRESDFCNGAGLRGWVADFDYLLKPDTQVKALEGKFGPPKITPPPPRDYEPFEVPS